MAYTKTVWQERIVATANKFLKTGETSSEVTLVNDPGTVTQAGTPFSVAAMNNIEDQIEALSKWTSFTPTISVSSGTFTPTIRESKYKNDGEFVEVYINMEGLASSSTFVDMTFSDLPTLISELTIFSAGGFWTRTSQPGSTGGSAAISLFSPSTGEITARAQVNSVYTIYYCLSLRIPV